MNMFFDSAIRRASSVAGKRSRLIFLLTRLGTKLSTVNWKNVRSVSVRDKFLTVGRMIKAYAMGDYRDLRWKTVLLLVAAIIYFVNPLDLIPDIVPLTGFTDDFAILLWVYNSVGQEIEKFITWEKSRLQG